MLKAGSLEAGVAVERYLCRYKTNRSALMLIAEHMILINCFCVRLDDFGSGALACSSSAGSATSSHKNQSFLSLSLRLPAFALLNLEIYEREE
jgi:hypothetical protein